MLSIPVAAKLYLAEIARQFFTVLLDEGDPSIANAPASRPPISREGK